MSKNSKKEKIDAQPKVKALCIENVNKKYKLEGKQTFQALFDVNVVFYQGELVSIVGESGSGKSTLMNLIGGLDSDFTGNIIVGQQNLRTLSDKQLDKYRKNKVGFVFQSFNLIPHLSILDNVTLALTLSNVPEKEKVERATKILQRVGLESQLKKKPNQLSGGQKQRVAIARALINDPEIIIADEPTGALDSQTSMQILQILKEIADSGKLVIMVTHSEKVASVSSRVVEISDGRIISDHTNADYVATKTEPIQPDDVTQADQNSSVSKTEKKKKKFGKDKQNLSLYQAVRLSCHNMWASKIKNFLMAFGVAIGIGSLILMMCFSSGITDFINNTMKSYSDPTIVTITKKSEDEDLGFETWFDYDKASFKDEDISALINGTEERQGLNAYLKEKGFDFQVSYTNNHEVDNLTPGIQMMTFFMKAKVIYNKDCQKVDYFNEEELKNSGLPNDAIMSIYTIPPYYSDGNISEGERCTSDGGVMFTKGIADMFKDHSIKDTESKNKVVDIAFPLGGTDFTFTEEITGIMDTSVMSGYLVMFIDYQHFQDLVKSSNDGKEFAPNVLYIKTGDANITAAINQYLQESGIYSGSIEDTFANMFESMTSVIGPSLIAISCISLMVSAMMILVVLYMSVSERTKEIGVLKSIGARRKDIKRIFTSESFLIGILSGLLGIVFNLVLTLVIYFVLKSTIGLAPISYRWWYFAVAIGVSVFISMLSGLYPASKAAKLDPVESLRRE